MWISKKEYDKLLIEISKLQSDIIQENVIISKLQNDLNEQFINNYREVVELKKQVERYKNLYQKSRDEKIIIIYDGRTNNEKNKNIFKYSYL